MPRNILEPSRIHASIQNTVSNYQHEIMDEVIAAVQKHDIVIVGMAANPHVKKARKLLTAAQLPFTYLEYGGYLSQWRKRGALKMWTGWPTFPMVFVKGILIGGASDTEVLINNGELKKMLLNTSARQAS